MKGLTELKNILVGSLGVILLAVICFLIKRFVLIEEYVCQ